MEAKFALKACLALLLLLSCAFSSKAEMLVRVLDSQGSSVPDAAVIISFQKNYSNPQLDGIAEGVTDSLGQWRGSVEFSPGAASVQYAFIRISTPYWASQRQQVRLPSSSEELLEVSFSSPVRIRSSRVRLISADGSPVQKAQVTLTRPYFLTKVTDFAGGAQFGTPEGEEVKGFVFYDGQAQEFSFTPKDEGIKSHDVRLPFLLPFDSDGATYSLSAQMSNKDGAPITNTPFEISPPFPPIKAMSDTAGRLRISGSPYRKVNISFQVANFQAPVEVDLAAPPEEIQQPPILKSSSPNAISLGEGCFRVQIEITDPRPNAQTEVSAQPIGNETKVAFVIDQSKPVGNYTVAFYRVICVQEDTSFQITAHNSYESLTVSVSLKRYVPPAPEVEEAVSIPIPTLLPEKKEDDRRLEVAVLLLLLLTALFGSYMAVHFREQALYLWQSIMRFLHVSYKGVRKGGKTIVYEKNGGTAHPQDKGASPTSGQPPAAPLLPTDIPQDQKPPDGEGQMLP